MTASHTSMVLVQGFQYLLCVCPAVSDKIMLEAWLWGTGGGANTTQAQQAAVAVLGTFRAALPGMPQPKEQLLLTRSFERYMLSQSVTDCYDVPEWAWSWANISTNEATLAAEDAWRSSKSKGARH